MTDSELLLQSTKRWADFKSTIRDRSIEENSKLRDTLEGTDLSIKWFMCMRRLYGTDAPSIHCDWRPSVVKYTADHDKIVQVEDMPNRGPPEIKIRKDISLDVIKKPATVERKPATVERKPTVEERKLDIWFKKKF